MANNNLARWKKEDCALLIIDMQYDFVADGGPFSCHGRQAIIPAILRVKQWAKANGIPVIYTQEVHRPAGIDYGLEAVNGAPPHCVEGTQGAEIVEELRPDPDDFIVRKRRFSAYYQTDLEGLLRCLGKKAVILCGVSTNVCVYSAALDSHNRDIYPVVLEDCVSGTTPELHRAFLEHIGTLVGDVLPSEELMNTL